METAIRALVRVGFIIALVTTLIAVTVFGAAGMGALGQMSQPVKNSTGTSAQYSPHDVATEFVPSLFLRLQGDGYNYTPNTLLESLGKLTIGALIAALVLRFARILTGS